MMVSGFASILQWQIVKLVFHIADKRFPGVAAGMSEGFYYPESDKTVVKTALAALTGGGIDKKKKRVDFDVHGNHP